MPGSCVRPFDSIWENYERSGKTKSKIYGHEALVTHRESGILTQSIGSLKRRQSKPKQSKIAKFTVQTSIDEKNY